MRDYGAPRSKMRTLRSSDVIAHWRLNEASGATVADAGPESTALTSAVTTNIVTGPFIGDAQNRGRVFATGQHSAGSSTAAQRAALLAGNWTIEVWARPTSLAGINAVIGHGSNAAGEANNYLASLRLDGSMFGAYWQRTSSKTAVQALTAPIAVLDELQHFAVRSRATGATREVTLLHNGIRAAVAAGLDPPTGGTNGSWELGALPVSHGSPFDGDIYEVRISSVSLSDEAIRDSASRGFRTWDVTRCINSGEASVHQRLWMLDGNDAWVDLSKRNGVNWLDGVEDSDNVDDDGASGRIELRRRNEWLSMGPFVSLSRVNVFEPDGRFLDLRRRFKIEEAVVPAGAPRSLAGEIHWALVFDGYAHVLADGDRISITLNDQIHPLQVAWCQPDRSVSPNTDFVYATSATPIETVLASILADHQPRSIAGVAEGYGNGEPVEIFTPTSPLFVVDNSSPTGGGGYAVPSSKSVAAAITDLVDTTIAWFLRYRWDDARQQFRLTLADPGRSKTWTTGDLVLAPHQIKRWRKLAIDASSIRNDVEVELSGPADRDNAGVDRRRSVRVEHAVSVARWWRSYCRVGLDSTSQISTTAQALNLAQMILSDLAYPLADIELELPARRDIEIGDIIRLMPDGVRADVAIDVAVVGVSHVRRAGARSTTITCRASAPIGRRRRILGDIAKSKGLRPPPSPSGASLERYQGALRVRWDFPANWGARRYRETEIHVGATSGFTPSSASLLEVVRGRSAFVSLPPGATAHVKLVHRDDMGNTSAPSSVVSGVARVLAVVSHARVRRASNQVLTVSATPSTIVWNTEDADPLNRHSTSTGTYTALHSGLLRVRAWALYDSNAKPSTSARLTIYVNGALVATGDVGTTNAGAAPNRAQLPPMDEELVVGVGDLVTVRVVASAGNVGQFIAADADNTKAWFTPLTED